MNIGRKNRRLTFDRPIDTTDGHGDALVDYATIGTVWASIEPLRGEERFEAQQVTADVTHKIRVRYSSTLAGLTPKHRARLGATTYDLLSINDINSGHRELEIWARVRV